MRPSARARSYSAGVDNRTSVIEVMSASADSGNSCPTFWDLSSARPRNPPDAAVGGFCSPASGVRFVSLLRESHAVSQRVMLRKLLPIAFILGECEQRLTSSLLHPDPTVNRPRRITSRTSCRTSCIRAVKRLERWISATRAWKQAQ